MSDLISLKLVASREDTSRAEAALEALEPAPLSVARFEEMEGGDWQLDALYGSPPDRDVIARALADRIGHTIAFDLAPLPDRNWVEESLKGLAPVRAGRLFLHGSHDRAGLPAGAIGLEIEAGAAFGTGHHATTLGCLLALQSIAKRQALRHVLDVGTGSGVLAIAAARHCRAMVVACDVDPVSVVVASRNARLNRVGNRIRVFRSDGLGHSAIRAGKPYDLIFANILARPLIDLAGDLAAVFSHRTKIVLSGLLDSQSAAVLSRYRAFGLVPLQRWSIEGWTTLVVGHD